jgi:hypothetical protein
MDVLLAMKAAVRRWYITVPMLLLTVAVAALSFSNSVSAWQTSGSLLILAPLAPSNTASDNGGTRLLAALLAANFNSDIVQAGLKAKGATGVFTAQASNELPLVSVSAEANSADAAADTLKIVLDNGDAVLADLQRRIGTNEADFYRSARSVEDSSPRFSASSRLVGAIGILVGGAAITVLISAVVDGLLTRRRRDDPAQDETESRDHPLPFDTPVLARPEHAVNGSASTTRSQPKTSRHPRPTQPPQPAGSPTSGPSPDQPAGQESR